jgi:hypothetical protein
MGSKVPGDSGACTKRAKGRVNLGSSRRISALLASGLQYSSVSATLWLTQLHRLRTSFTNWTLGYSCAYRTTRLKLEERNGSDIIQLVRSGHSQTSSSLSFAPPSNSPPLPGYSFSLCAINTRAQSLIAVQFSPEGSLWQDPPGYWDDIVWPAYLKAHKNIFVGGDVSYGDAIVIGEGHGVESPTIGRFPVGITGMNGKGQHDSGLITNGVESISRTGREEDEGSQKESPAVCGKPVPRLIILPAETMDMEGLFETACTALQEAV